MKTPTAEPKNRIIVALDVPSSNDAFGLVNELHDYVGSFKIGLEYMNNLMAKLLRGTVHEAQRELQAARQLIEAIGGKLFWDGKLADIPQTVLGAATGTSALKVRMFNVHCTGGPGMMEHARGAADVYSVEYRIPRPLVLGVTLLTSLGYDKLRQLGFQLGDGVATSDEDKEARVIELVASLAKLAQASGLDGAICSAKEAPAVRQACGEDFRIVTPSIRPTWSLTDDQDPSRVVTPAMAFEAGADEAVIGRAITKPKTGSRVDAAKRIADEIAAALA